MDSLMTPVRIVFQNSRLLKGTLLDNVKLGKPDATEEEVLTALKAAQCMDIVEKFPDALCTKSGIFAKMWQDYGSSVQWKVTKEG